jgi:hypothetical protein
LRQCGRNEGRGEEPGDQREQGDESGHDALNR